MYRAVYPGSVHGWYRAQVVLPGYTRFIAGQGCTRGLQQLVVHGAGVTLWARAGFQGLGKSLWSHYPAQSCPASSRRRDGKPGTRKSGNGQQSDSARATPPIITLEEESRGESLNVGDSLRARENYLRIITFAHFCTLARHPRANTLRIPLCGQNITRGKRDSWVILLSRS